MTHITVTSILGSDLADAGTTTFTLPDPYEESMVAESGHILAVSNGATYDDGSKDFTISVAGQVVTLTNCTEATIPSGSKLYLQVALKGGDNVPVPSALRNLGVQNAQLIVVPLGTPATADVDGVLEAYTGDGTTIALDGALVSDGVATFDVPRNIVVDSGGADTAVLTFTGTDVHGNAIVESITLNGTTAVAGKKAFKTITDVSSSGAIANGAFAGPGDVLGLPVYLPTLAHVIAQIEDGASATAGTVVAGVLTEPTATTGDVRGTYDPNSACDGNKAFTLIMIAEGFNYNLGQYAG